MAAPKDLVPIGPAPKAPPPGAQETGNVDPKEMVRVTVRIRPRTPIQTLHAAVHALAGLLPQQRQHLNREQFAQQHGADPADLKKVEEFAHQHGLTVRDSSSARRSVHLEGPAEAMSQAFGVAMKLYQHQGHRFRVRTDQVKIPADLQGVIEAVVGFDTRPHARPHFRIAQAPTGAVHAQAVGHDFFPPALAKLYDFPAGADGSDQVIGIIELTAPHGSGFRPAELQQYFSSLQISAPQVTAVSVDGAQNAPGTDPSDRQCADGEVMLDIEVAGAVAPKAKVIVYFAPNTAQGFLDVINHAVHDSVHNPSVISLSWGAAENAQDPTTDQINQILQAAAVMGVTFCVASGDSGSRDDPDNPTNAAVDFPASSPFALGCGGTTLQAAGASIQKETVWFDGSAGSGGGVSRLFDLPDYQKNAGVPPAKNPTGPVRRGVPDVAGDADPATGYKILVDSKTITLGGTSAVAPLWAGLVALLNQKVGRPVGFLNPLLYQHTDVCNDITDGTNGDYEAGSGWDPCTGLGSPDGSKLLRALSGTPGGPALAGPHKTAGVGTASASKVPKRS
jgi:kumamolisin